MCGFYSNPTADWSLYALVVAVSVGIPSSRRRRKNFRLVRCAPLRPLSCSPEAPFKEKAIAGERVSILSFRLADPASSASFPTFPSLLPLSKENFELALGFTFIVSCGVAKRKPFYRILTQEGTRDTIQSRPQTCHGTRLAKVKSW